LTDRSRPHAALEAAIFDFNGTLFRDAWFHDRAWSVFGERHDRPLNPGELEHRVLGFTNKEILAYLFERTLTDDESDAYSREKEALYRDLCRSRPEKCVLASGAEDFLDFLKHHRIKRAIATASIRENIDFFYETFELGRWFELDEIIFDDGEHRGKPFPDMFLSAGKRLDVPLQRCMIIEDSLSGIEAAKRAGAGCIVAISEEKALSKFDGVDGIDQLVSDFADIDSGGLIKMLS
jgi:beta-phosphoglucomutase